MRIKTIGRVCGNIALCALVVHLVFIQITVPLVFACRFVNPPITGIRLYRAVFYGWKERDSRFLSLRKIPLGTRRMILRVEDGNFYDHHGVVFAAFKNAWKINKSIGRPLYGGSTITMQTARTLFLVPEKSYLRKYLEIIVALEMETILGKDRIFELYLNNAEWGKGVYGIDAASRYHYKKSVANLTTDEAIRLVTLLSSPIKYTPYTIQKNGILRSRYAYLVGRFSAE
ncbi:MAG TPA: biosynthetic peptidoglycan transglycosylase [Treponemataceae bacterium]|nr:biosynthetic peptidoglycan transglycosylase [Treponemataceae bacterium]